MTYKQEELNAKCKIRKGMKNFYILFKYVLFKHILNILF